MLIPQALGSDEFLRVTWHRSLGVLVFSHWDGDRCIAATPVRASQIGELAELTVAALAAAVQRDTAGWPSPLARDLVATAIPIARPA